MARSDELMRCFVLMPFQDDCELIYQEVIIPIFGRLVDKRTGLWDVSKANSPAAYEVDRSKVEAIDEQLQTADLLIFNLTALRPEVLYELGEAAALRKRKILMAEEGTELPFNLRADDCIFYRNDPDGRSALAARIEGVVLSKVHAMRLERASLAKDEDILASNHTILDNLQHISASSLLRRFALSEVRRLANESTTIRNGRYELRNERPTHEIVSFYEKYLYDLAGDDSSFDAVTCFEFWFEMTQQSRDFEYLHANIYAAENGAAIRRVFLMDRSQFPEDTVAGHEGYARVLQEVYEETKGRKIDIRIRFTDDYEQSLHTYGVFGILRKGDEFILFRPEYSDGPAKRMLKTVFTHYDGCTPTTASSSENKEDVNSRRVKFDLVWKDPGTVRLSRKHFLKPRPK
jgi:hypothetical protein